MKEAFALTSDWCEMEALMPNNLWKETPWPNEDKNLDEDS